MELNYALFFLTDGRRGHGSPGRRLIVNIGMWGHCSTGRDPIVGSL